MNISAIVNQYRKVAQLFLPHIYSGLHAILLALRPVDAPSLSTVDRQVKAVREESMQWVKKQAFPRRAVLHFDGVKVNLGSKNGNRRVEHLAVTVTGLGEEFKIGIFECANGTGKQ